MSTTHHLSRVTFCKRYSLTVTDPVTTAAEAWYTGIVAVRSSLHRYAFLERHHHGEERYTHNTDLVWEKDP